MQRIVFIDGNINAADLPRLKSALHSRYKTLADSSAAVIRMDGNAEITAVILLNRTNQRTDDFSFILSNYNEIRIP